MDKMGIRETEHRGRETAAYGERYAGNHALVRTETHKVGCSRSPPEYS